jgi:hypothetical protein
LQTICKSENALQNATRASISCQQLYDELGSTPLIHPLPPQKVKTTSVTVSHYSTSITVQNLLD